MKYNELTSMIIPFINVRWGDIVYPTHSLKIAVENGIQQIINEYNWSWLFTSEKIPKEDFVDWTIYHSFHLWPTKEVEFVLRSRDKCLLRKVQSLIELDEDSYLLHWDYVMLLNPEDVTVGFYKDYTWRLFQPNGTEDIPMPDKVIPALYYLVLSQIDMIEVNQPEQEVRTNYNKYQDQIKLLKDNDRISTSWLKWGGRD